MTIIAPLVTILIVVPVVIILIVMAVVAVGIVATTVIIGRCRRRYQTDRTENGRKEAVEPRSHKVCVEEICPKID